jgi:hypothetical protein
MAVHRLCGLGALVFAGCAPQATTDYEGDAMFSLTGRVELTLEESDDLIPALAFTSPGGFEVQFVEADVSGEFPASFQLELYAPPPASVVGGQEYEEHPGDPPYSIGYVVAVTPDHLSTLYMAGQLLGGGEECGESTCDSEYTASTFDAAHSGTVTVTCPATHPGLDITDPLSCELSGRSGDPMLVTVARDPMFAGAATNYVVAYLEAAAPAGGYLAHRLGAPEGLSAGYHLLRTMPMIFVGPNPDPALVEAETVKQACRDQAKADAVVSYNAVHGTHVTESSIVVTGCNEPGCEQFGPDTRGLRGEWYRLMAENGCPMGAEYTPESDPDSVVSLEVQPGLNFLAAAAGLR